MTDTIWSILGSLLIYGQRFLVYPHGFVDAPHVSLPSEHEIPFDDLRLPTPDNENIACHLMLFSKFYADFRPHSKESEGLSSCEGGSPCEIVQPESKEDDKEEGENAVRGRATILLFHGNAMNHGDRLDIAVQFLIMGFNVLTVSYRGYAHSTGRPSEKGLRIDAQTALDYLTSHPKLSRTPIILYGQSLGGAVSISLASRNPTSITALIIENTFTSIPDLVGEWPNILGKFSFLCTQRWPSLTRIRGLPADVPILMLSGERDTVTPAVHMRRLWAAARCRKERESRMKKQEEGREKEGGVGCMSGFPFTLCNGNVEENHGESGNGSPDEHGDKGGDAMTLEEVEMATREEMMALKSPFRMWDGKSMFRSYKGTGHNNTYTHPSYWTDIRRFIDRLGLSPPVHDPDFDDIFSSTTNNRGSIFHRR